MEEDREGSRVLVKATAGSHPSLRTLHSSCLYKGPDSLMFMEHHFLYSYVNPEELIHISMISKTA